MVVTSRERVDRSRLQVLLIAEDPTLTRRVSHCLAGTVIDRALRHAPDVTTAVELLGDRHADAVLVDLDISSGRGLEVIERLGRADTRPPIIALGGQDGEDADRAISAGAADFLSREELSPRALARVLHYAHLRHRTARERWAAEERWATVFDVLPVGLVISDAGTGRLLEMNQAFATMFGARPGDLRGTTSVELGMWEDPDRRLELVDRAMRHGSFYGEEAGFRSLDGRRGRMLVSCRRLVLSGEDRLLWSVQDVTETRRAEEWRNVLESAVDATDHGIVITDRTGSIVWSNPAFSRMTGWTWPDIRGRNPRVLKSGLQDEAFYQELWSTILAGETWRGELVNRRRDGSLYPEGMSVVPVRHRGDAITHFIAIKKDVSEERAAREALRRSEQRFRKIFENSRDPISLTTESGHVVRANRAWLEFFGVGESEPPTVDTISLYVDDAARQSLLERLREDGAVSDFEIEARLRDGAVRTVQLTASLLDEDGESRILSIVRDVTERRLLEDDLRHRALHDPLTGLANRTLLRERLEWGVARARRNGATLALLMTDVCRFKRINDGLGHTAGDRVLEEVGRRLTSEARENDTVARFGGDEFAIVLGELTRPDDALTTAHRLLRSLRRPIHVLGRELEVDLNVGVALYDPDRASGYGDVEQLIRHADIALIEAKKKAGESVHVYRDREDRSDRDLLRLEQDIRRGLDRKEFEVFFQPVVSLAGGRIWGWEALARWRHPERGILGPSDFIPLAEEIDVIHELGEQLCRAALGHASGWVSRPDAEPTRLLMNVSGRQFESDRFPAMLERCLEESELGLAQIYLEITESAVIRATDRVRDMRSRGVAILVDDFGTGYSSFHYLRDLEVDGLKIDMSFVQGLTEDGNSGAIVETMLTLGRRMGVLTIAEGVESTDQVRRLRELGADLVQGFRFSRPLCASDVKARLNSGSAGWRLPDP